jgi:hypothetical protein
MDALVAGFRIVNLSSGAVVGSAGTVEVVDGASTGVS